MIMAKSGLLVITCFRNVVEVLELYISLRDVKTNVDNLFLYLGSRITKMSRKYETKKSVMSKLGVGNVDIS